ncbi:hypothetical protein U1Q18_001981 [Sarracenia purpurea var. burkii]
MKRKMKIAPNQRNNGVFRTEATITRTVTTRQNDNNEIDEEVDGGREIDRNEGGRDLPEKMARYGRAGIATASAPLRSGGCQLGSVEDAPERGFGDDGAPMTETSREIALAVLVQDRGQSKMEVGAAPLMASEVRVVKGEAALGL